MIVKVCGMREAENIREVSELGVDWIGLIFWPQSPRYVSMIPTHAGTIPDRPSLHTPPSTLHTPPKRVGVFVNATAQDIITRVVNYGLDMVQLHGSERPTFVRNLKHTLDDKVLMMKTISVASACDLSAWHDYADCADYFLFDTKCAGKGGSGRQFDWTVLQAYDGHVPFLLSGGIGPGDAGRLRDAFAPDGNAAIHPRCVGIDLNSRFETAPAVKDIGLLRSFLSQIGKR